MAAGWNLSQGEIKKYYVSEDDLWADFNYVFSDACAKRSTYKFGLIKAMLDNLLSAVQTNRGVELTYEELFSKFAENYWNLVTKYHLRQMRKTTLSEVSKLELIFNEILETSGNLGLEFDSLSEQDKTAVIHRVTKECKKSVIGAVYQNFRGQLFGFDLKDSGIWINPVAYEFMLKYKPALEQLNYYAWAKFLESINDENTLVRIIDKLELSTPARKDLSIYRDILRQEFEIDTCFYCGRKIAKTSHVDHVIPWSFVKADHLWNFVLTCPECNLKKKNKMPNREGLTRVIIRNEHLCKVEKPFVFAEFRGYSSELMWKIWNYAKVSGIRIFE